VHQHTQLALLATQPVPFQRKRTPFSHALSHPSRRFGPLHHCQTPANSQPYSVSQFAEKQSSFTIDVLSIASSNPHVMHALLAASALHIRFATVPTLTEPPPPSLTAALTTSRGSGSRNNDDFAYIEAGHHLSASSGFRRALASLDTTTDIDPLLTTCMLLNMLSFAGLPEPEDHTRRWPFLGYGGDRPLGWLRIQLGFAPLMGGLSTGVKEESAWMRFFQGLGHEVFYDERDGVEGLPVGWCGFWGIDEGSRIEGHRYLRVVRRLVRIWEVWCRTEAEGGGGRRHDEQCLRYLQFMQGVDEGVSA
jgi:hypothetical protein